MNKTPQPKTSPASSVPFFTVDSPFHIVYRNNSTSSPVLPHTHNALELYFTLTDLPDVLLDDTVSGVSKGSLIIIPPYYVHQLFNQREKLYERYIISINNAWLDSVFRAHPHLMEYASQANGPFILPLSSEQQAQLIHYLQPLLELPVPDSVMYYADFFSLLAVLDSIITREHAHAKYHTLSINRSQKTVNKIIRYINEHLTDNITLEDIAGHFYMNKDYLSRLFKAHTHSTIGHYIALQKVTKAQSLLASGLSVAAVQEKMGFSSYAYFFKFFKKMTGISPSHYRHSQLESTDISMD